MAEYRRVDAQSARYDAPMRRLRQLPYVVAMVVGSVAMWLGSPVLWLYLAGRTGRVSGTSMSSILILIGGTIVTIVVLGKLLARLDAAYTARFGVAEAGARSPARWLRSLRGGRIDEQPTLIDKVMVPSVAAAMLLVGIYLAFFSEGVQAPH